MMTNEVVRICRFRPYRKGMGPVFCLKVWDTNSWNSYGKNRLGYRLSIGQARHQNTVGNPAVWTVLFEGEDFYCSPSYAVDSDEMVAALMSFLTLRPGDTDADYFDAYTPEQRAFCAKHAEALAGEVQDRFGHD